jgi:hypothetical protein
MVNAATQSSKKMAAEMNTAACQESREEVLWAKRTQLEKRVEKREKMIYNAQEVIGSALTWNVARQILRDEVEKMEKEIQALRTNMVLVDREIRVAETESDESEEGKEEADAMELAAREAKGYAHAVRQERQRMEDEVRRMGELEAKLEAVGKM